MEINCEQLIEEYLLNKNPLYSFSFPISLLIAIVVFGISKARNWSSNSYINQILIPILTFLLTMVVIDIVSRMMISSEEKAHLIQKCKIWMHDPDVRSDPILSKNIDIEMVISYNENEAIERFNNIEHFNIQNNQYDNN